MKWLLVLLGPAMGIISWWGVKLFIYPPLTLPLGISLKMCGIVLLSLVLGGGTGFVGGIFSSKSIFCRR